MGIDPSIASGDTGAIRPTLLVRRRMQTEHQTQSAIKQFLDLVLPPTYRVVAISNNPRSRRTGAREKARGMRRGFPDLVIIGPEGLCAFMEVKTDRGRLSPAQLEWAGWLTRNGAAHSVVRSIDDVRECLREWNIPVREVMA